VVEMHLLFTDLCIGAVRDDTLDAFVTSEE
jgi:hypothetical protein